MLTSWAVFRVGNLSAFTAGLLWPKKIPENDTKAAENLNDSKNNYAIGKYHLLTLMHVCFISLWQKIHSEYECRQVRRDSVIRESCKNLQKSN